MATGIKDKVAILGMGCSRFGERWDANSSELMREAFDEALADAGIERSQIEAGWYGSAMDNVNVGNSAIPASTALRLDGIPFSRMENMCATGTEALRGAAYAVRSEEHTSELQSLMRISYAVFCLKKKQPNNQ